MIKSLAKLLISQAERKLGVSLDYVHKIAQTDIRLLTRYNKIFSFLDPNKKVPPLAYHTARIRGAIAADCGTCVEVEINLAKQAGIDAGTINSLLAGDYDAFAPEISAIAKLADRVTGERVDDTNCRETIVSAFGEAGLIELSFAMNGAAMIPGIKRAMGYATTCDIAMMQRINAPK